MHIQVGQCGNQISSKVFVHAFDRACDSEAQTKGSCITRFQKIGRMKLSRSSYFRNLL